MEQPDHGCGGFVHRSCVRQRHVKCNYWLLSVKKKKREIIMRRLNEKMNQMLIAGYVRGIRVKERVFETLNRIRRKDSWIPR